MASIRARYGGASRVEIADSRVGEGHLSGPPHVTSVLAFFFPPPLVKKVAVFIVLLAAFRASRGNRPSIGAAGSGLSP